MGHTESGVAPLRTGDSGSKAQPERAVGCLGIIHIPKTGGAALRDTLARIPGCYTGPIYYDPAHFGSAELLQALPEPNRSAVATPHALADLVGHHEVLIGHYSATSLIEAGCAALASQVREPRARVLSLYRFWQSTPPDERASWGLWGTSLIARADMPFDKYLASKSVWPAIENSMARQLLGERLRVTPAPFIRSRRAMVNRSAYSELMQHIRALGWPDRPDDFVQRVCDMTGAAHPPLVGRVNVTKVSGEVQRLAPQTLRLLERITAADRSLLDAMMSDGVLDVRLPHQLDEDFADTAERLGFRL